MGKTKYADSALERPHPGLETPHSQRQDAHHDLTQGLAGFGWNANKWETAVDIMVHLLHAASRAWQGRSHPQSNQQSWSAAGSVTPVRGKQSRCVCKQRSSLKRTHGSRCANPQLPGAGGGVTDRQHHQHDLSLSSGHSMSTPV